MASSSIYFQRGIKKMTSDGTSPPDMVTKQDLKNEAEAAFGKPSDASKAAGVKDEKPVEKVNTEAKTDVSATSEKSAIAEDKDSAAPKVPERPQSPFSRTLGELKEAFPTEDIKVLRAVLVSGGGSLESAFNGLLALQDDTIRPPPSQDQARLQQSQIAHDEEVARNLAKNERRRGSRQAGAGDHRAGYNREYDEYGGDFGAPPPRGSGEEASLGLGPRRSNRAGYNRQYDEYGGDFGAPPAPARSNDEPDLATELRDNLQKGFNETSKRVGSFFATMRDRFNNEFGENEEEFYEEPPRRQDQSRPPLPPRKDSNLSSRGEQAPSQPPRPKQVRPVNAFGEEQPSRWEPLPTSQTNDDAFFIGESDSDLESLTGDQPESKSGAKSDKSEKSDKPEKSEKKKVEKLADVEPTAEPAAEPETKATKTDKAETETEKAETKAKSKAKEALEAAAAAK